LKIKGVNTSGTFIALCFFNSLVYSQSEATIALDSSVIPFQFTSSSIPMLHLVMKQEKDGIRLMGGLQFQPTKNLLIGGVLAPNKIEADLSIYYHIVIGYIPKWQFFNLSSNMFQIGMHRNRYGTEGDARWFSFSLMESARFGSFNLNYCWNHLFTQNWNRDTILISTDLKLSNSIHFRPGAIAYFVPDIDFTPCLFVSIDL